MTANREETLSSLLAEAHGDGRGLLLACFDYAARHTDFFKQRDAAEQVLELVKEVRLEHSIVPNADEPDHSSSSSSSSSSSDSEEENDSMTSGGSSDVPATPALYDETTIEEVVDDVEEKRNVVDVDEKKKKTDADADAADADAADADNDDNKKKKKPAFRKPNAGNGLDLDTYSWTQTLAEVVISVPLVKGTKAKDCEVKINKDSLRVAVRGGGAGGAPSSSSSSAPSPSSSSSSFVPILDGPLEAAVKPADCFWNILDGQTLEITLTKADGMRWWSRVVVGGKSGDDGGGDDDDGARIDTTKVEPENSKLGDLDAETRATVEKMMWDQRQKALGLPTSEEARKAEILEKFKAQHPELDFSQAKIG